MIICYISEIWHMADVSIFILSYQVFFLKLPAYTFPFYPLNSPQKMKISKQWKKGLEISFYTSVPKIMIICYPVPEIWHVSDVIFIFHFGQWMFSPFTPLTAQKRKISKQRKNHLEISSFYTSIAKIIIICYTVHEI